MDKSDIISLCTDKLKILYDKTNSDYIQKCNLYNLPPENLKIIINNNKIKNKYIITDKYKKDLSSKKSFRLLEGYKNIYKQNAPIHLIEDLIEELEELKIMKNELKKRYKIERDMMKKNELKKAKIVPLIINNFKSMEEILRQ